MTSRFSKITRQAIKELPPGQRINEHGIIVHKQSTGGVRYSINVMVDGMRIHRVVGRESDGVTRLQAERLIEKLRSDALADRLDLPHGRKLHRTLREAASEYLERMEQAGGKDLKNKRRHLERYLVPYLGKERLDQISAFTLQRYRKMRRDQGITDATINREFATLLHLLNRAIEWRWMKGDHKPKIPRAVEERQLRRALSPAQAKALYEAALLDHDSRLWLFVLIGLGTGMRHSEILARRYDEIDWHRNRFEIGKAKAGARLQPFPQSVREGLLRQRKLETDKGGYLFPPERPGRCKKPHRTAMDQGFRRAVIAAGLDPAKVTPHLMRHTLVTNLSATTDVATIQKISGHKTAAMVMHYTHVNDERIDNALSNLEANVLGAITQELHTPSTTRSQRPRRRAGTTA